jgi:hypothetical protein
VAASPDVLRSDAHQGDSEQSDVEPAGVEAAEGGPSSDGTTRATGRPPRDVSPLAARDVDVVLGAAAAAAADLADEGFLHPTSAEQDVVGRSGAAPGDEQPPGQQDEPAGNGVADADERRTAGRSRPEAEGTPGSVPSAEAGNPAAAADDADAEDRDATDRLPRVGRRKPAASDGEDDLLRTTAQLAILLDDLEGRDSP